MGQLGNFLNRLACQNERQQQTGIPAPSAPFTGLSLHSLRLHQTGWYTSRLSKPAAAHCGLKPAEFDTGERPVCGNTLRRRISGSAKVRIAFGFRLSAPASAASTQLRNGRNSVIVPFCPNIRCSHMLSLTLPRVYRPRQLSLQYCAISACVANQTPSWDLI